MFSNDEVKNYSAVKNDPFGINLYESYDGYEPKKGGLVDLRLGTCDIHLNCTTCGLNSMECNGHFGHTVLSQPIFHFGFLMHLKNVLQCICLRCSNMLIDKNEKILKEISNYNGKHRFKFIKDICRKTVYCYNCGAPVPKIKREVKDSGTIKIILEREIIAAMKDEKTGIMVEGKRKIKEFLSPNDCYDILRNVSDTDNYLLGFNPKKCHLEDLIIKNFPIPPVIIRPTAKIDFLASSTMEDSMTLKIADIIKTNIRIRKQMNRISMSNDGTELNQDNLNLLQYHIATYFDNESVSLPRSEFKTGGRPVKSVSDRIKGKAGRVRSNLMGKRVDFSGRSVITSDPNINIDELGIPLKVAKILTIPEEVTPKNIKYLTELVQLGPKKYPGANFVYRTINMDGKIQNRLIDLRYRRKGLKLNYGDTVERHIVNGDYVLFNRQPTLHKVSMMGHKIHVINKENINTFRMNVAVTSPYNADFDGDEMNIFVPQSIQARNELEMIANVKLQIISAKDSSPIIGCVQDTVAGSYLLSHPDVKMTGSDAMYLLGYTNIKSLSNIDKNKYYSGSEIFSTIIPNGINSIKWDEDGKVIFKISNGNLVTGLLKKASLANKKNSIIHYIWDKYGAEKTRKFIDDSQRMILSYLLMRGMTVGYGDAFVSDKLLEEIQQLVDTKILEQKYQLTEYENDSEIIDKELFEEIVTRDLNSINGNVGKMIIDQMDSKNNFGILTNSGSKGGTINIGQMMGCLGQQSIEGARIKKRVYGRTIPHYHQNDDTPAARGFVQSSLLDGLNAYEFFFHAMGGREGLIDTAIKTATIGYIQRKLIKGLEDYHVEYDGTVRTSKGMIIQYIYGGNNINQSVQSEIKLLTINMGDTKIYNKFAFSDKEVKLVAKKLKIKKKDLEKLNNDIYKKLLQHRDVLRKIQMLANNNYMVLQDKYMLPINIYRIIQDNSSDKTSIELSPFDIIDEIEKFISYETIQLIPFKNKDKKFFKYKDDDDFKLLIKIALYEYLAPKRCIFEYGLTKKSFKLIINELVEGMNKALVEPGEMVGVVAAQSIGEPTTQITLNTKHFAGVAGKGYGTKKLQELMSYSKNIKVPYMRIYFDEQYCTNRKVVHKISSFLQYVTINDLINQAEIYYNPSNDDDNGKLLKKDNVQNPFFIGNQKVDIYSLPWVFRLTMNREKLLDKETTLLDIKTKFISYWYNNLTDLKKLKRGIKDIMSKISRCAILSNFETSSELIIQIRFNIFDFSYKILTDFLDLVINNITLKGIQGIKGINIAQERKLSFDPKTKEPVVNKEYVVYTDGINMKNIKLIKGVNQERTLCNDIATIYRRYGIEAARTMLFHEVDANFSGSGVTVNRNHLLLLVDVMTHTGNIISIDRHGLNKLDVGPLSKASFEKTMEHFINGAIYNETDNLLSTSARVMVGRVIKGGTGMFDLIMDTKLLENSEYGDDDSGGRIMFKPLNTNSFVDDIFKKMDINVDFYIPN